MDGRKLITAAERLAVFLDSDSIDRLLHQEDGAARKLMLYRDASSFEFIRSEKTGVDERLAPIAQAEKRSNLGGELVGLDVNRTDGRAQYGFFYRDSDVETIGKTVFGKNALTAQEKERIQLVFIQAVLNGHDGGNLFLTADEILLRKRWWFESHFPGGRLNIATIDEGLEVMDLFAKNKGIHYVSSHYTANKGLWYWYSFRSKIPFYNVPMELVSASPSIESLARRHIMESFASRFVFLLSSLDQMGVQFYSGVDNDTMDSTIYHFNYFISLVPGIFDALAIETKTKLRLKFEREKIPSRTSLSVTAGRDFLRALREENRELRAHISAFADLINLIYMLRESVIHTEGLRDATFEFRNQDSRWKANFLSITTEIARTIERCGDRRLPYDFVSEWGVYRHRSSHYLCPFLFSKAAASMLVSFSNTYLETLGFTNFIEALDATTDFRQTIERFKRDRLGF